ncbi:hypothetical protein AC249_AIPGENE15186 [Exaiptasia diaphana]|nr:hypothetical protein AC249_AIPGENE15186 [Exaiptasia diaphana]
MGLKTVNAEVFFQSIWSVNDDCFHFKQLELISLQRLQPSIRFRIDNLSSGNVFTLYKTWYESCGLAVC